MRRRIVIFLVVVQTILFAAHWFVYRTWVAFQATPDPPGISALGATVGILSITFLVASLLARRYKNLLVRVFYTTSAVWLGLLSFFFLAACSCWILYAGGRIAGLHWRQQSIAFATFGAAVVVTVYGMLNAARIRVSHIAIHLPNLPAVWRGRVAALVSDMHLGHVRGYRFAERVVAILSRLEPGIVLIAGDMYDGTAADVRKFAEPLALLSPPQGSYFIAGNHDEFFGQKERLDAVADAGVRVLNNEKVVVDGLQIVGVHHHGSVNAANFRSILRNAKLDANCASILLTHAPNQLPIAEEEKIGLLLAGHTHGGQFFPFTWLTSRIYGRFVHGLRRLGNLQVFTSYGVGTWGPPLRVGTSPEIVLITFT